MATDGARPRPAARLVTASAIALLVAGALAPAGALGASPVTAAAPAAPDPASKLRGDLADQVAGSRPIDPRIPSLVPGFRSGDLAYFAILSEPDDAIHEAAISGLGGRVLRHYRTIDAFAIVSDPVTVLEVAALPWVRRLEPIEVVVPLQDEPLADQTRGGPHDVGADALWARGIIGSGTRIAILDTGYDPTHPDLDDLDFGHWSSPLNGAKVVDARNFNGGGCAPLVGDGHGHGTHVASIAAGTGEGTPAATDDGLHAGTAPGAQLAIGKVLTDAGAGINSDLIAALEWAAMPAESGPTGCAVGADVVNLSLGSESRPSRLNSGTDVDLVSQVANRLAVRYGTLIVAAVGNSGPYIGSALETPGSAAQVLSVGAAAKAWDLNHDDTASGDTCAGWEHPRSASASDNDCTAGTGTQGPSVASFSSRGPSGDLWLRPDLVAPGYNIVAAQAATGTALGTNDLNGNTRTDPLYATASGTSMASPATAGAAALLLDAYRREHAGQDPGGPSGITGLTAPRYVLLKAALMNSAAADLREARWILTLSRDLALACPPEIDPLGFGLCDFATTIADAISQSIGSLTLYEVRNGAADPWVGPLAEGAGKLRLEAAVAALSRGLVVYSAASGSGASLGTGPRDFQGSWQVGAIQAGDTSSQRFVVRSAPGAAATTATFAFDPGHPSDGSVAIPTSGPLAWTVTLPARTAISGGGSAVVAMSVKVPAGATPGVYTGAVLVSATSGQTLRIPVFAVVSLHDQDGAAGVLGGAQAALASAHDVFAKGDTSWPSAAGAANGAAADWQVLPLQLAAGLAEARLSVYDAAAGDETYDLYVYDAGLDLVASSHPFAADGTTDVAANSQRGPSTPSAPTRVTLVAPAAGRYFVAINRARIGQSPLEPAGDFGAWRLALDEVAPVGSPRAATLTYDGDRVVTQGSPLRLAATLQDAAGRPVAGRLVTFAIDGTAVPCPGGPCTAVTNSDGLAQVASSPIQAVTGIHDLTATFAGDAVIGPARASAFLLVVGSSTLPVAGGRASGGAWFVPDGRVPPRGADGRVDLALHIAGSAEPVGDIRWRDGTAGLDLRLDTATAIAVQGTSATIVGTFRDASGARLDFRLDVTDGGEPGRGTDRVRLQVPALGYDVTGILGGGNLQVADR